MACSGFDFSGQRAFIAGASGCVGRAIALALASAGAATALHGRRNADALAALADEIAARDAAPSVHLKADLRDRGDARRALDEAWQALGGLDTLVIACGTARDGPLAFLGAADLEAALADNLDPVVHLCEAFCARREALPGGRIVIVSSITGLSGQPMRSAYGAAKGAVIGYAKSLARSVADRGMTVNCLVPQVVQGGIAEHMTARMQDLLEAITPLQRPCTSEEVASAALFLASPGASFITGSCLNITGGLITW